jgi:NAD(P)-dependent dehydrogenase (short-subunit alcohol dehydrogenase family)
MFISSSSSSTTDAQAAARTVDEVVGGLDVVFANAGIAENWEEVVKVDPRSCFKVGPLILFQALYPVRKLVTIQSLVDAIADMLKAPSIRNKQSCPQFRHETNSPRAFSPSRYTQEMST